MADENTENVNDGRKYQTGEVLRTDQGNMVVHGVSYQERENEAGETERHSFSYQLRHEEDVVAEQKAAEEAEAAEKARLEAEQADREAQAEAEAEAEAGEAAPQE